MLIAVRTSDAERVEAARDTVGEFRCPECAWPVLLKRGKVVVAHFAHVPGAPACDSGGESVTHMAAKALLARRFREAGYTVDLEVPEPGYGRRVNVVVTLDGADGRRHRVAVEVQDSAIAVEEVKRRGNADRAGGYFATVWVFTTNRLAKARESLPGAELRLPKEIGYLHTRWNLPVNVLDVNREHLWLVTAAPLVRAGGAYVNADGEDGYSSDRVLKATRRVAVEEGIFQLTAAHGRYATGSQPDYTAVFVPAEAHPAAWTVTVWTATEGELVTEVSLAHPPTDGPWWEQAVSYHQRHHDVQLHHGSTNRTWRLQADYSRWGRDCPDYRWEFTS